MNGKTEYKDRYWLHALLFLLTLASTVWTGGNMTGRVLLYEELGWGAFLLDGLRYGGTLVLFLTVHEFGHYFAARRHGVSTSLPYYIPLPISIIGTLGAVIRIREPLPNKRKLFDIGAAGPLAGFAVALVALLWALLALPDPSYMLDLGGHEALKEYIRQFGAFPQAMPGTGPAEENVAMIVFGQTPLYWFLTQFFAGVPPMYEMYHYPVLLAAWFGLFFTALNLLPVGQLDGGHILYSLVGPKWHGRIARGFVLLLLLSASIGYVNEVIPWLFSVNGWLGRGAWFILATILYLFLSRVFGGRHMYMAPALFGLVGLTALARWIGEPAFDFGYWPWFIWVILIIAFIRIDHPPVLYEEPLTRRRRWLGILSLVIFVLCFSFRPIHIV